MRRAARSARGRPAGFARARGLPGVQGVQGTRDSRYSRARGIAGLRAGGAREFAALTGLLSRQPERPCISLYKRVMPPKPADSSSSPGVTRWLAALALSALAGVIYALYVGLLRLPPHLDPWAPLEVAAPPDWLTPYKLGRARSDPARCLAALNATGMQYDVLPDRETGPGCGFENAVRLRSAAIRFGPPLALSCPVALSFYMWDRHALQPAAEAMFGQRVVAVEHFGSYACRNVNRGEGVAPGASRSRHATADALDIASFTLADGRRVAVTEWQDEAAGSSPEADWLRRAHAGACRYFDGVLGPDYNAAHRDHFHLETGGWRLCR
jgi:hypothetical protein